MSLRSFVRSLIGRLPRRLLYEVFYQSARALGVQSYEVDGSVGRFFGPLYDQSVIKHYLETGAWSENILGLFQGYFSEHGGTLYDVGANIGLFTVPMARDARVSVVAFEPDPHNCALLRANIAVAGVAAEIVNAAVAQENGTARFARSDYNSGDHRLAAGGTISVRTVRLDDYMPMAGRFAVKIDTQGAEPLIFRGGETVLSSAGLIVSEFWPWGMRRMGLDADIILSFAASHFNHGLVLRHDEVAGEPVPIAEIIERLRGIMASADEHDAVDLVLMRR